MQLWPGWPYPLGATYDGEGVNFAIFSEHATAVHLCLFDSAAATVESASIPLTERTDGVWHGYLPAGRPGQLYGFRAHGLWQPERGLRFNPAKVLLDPYARAIGRPPFWHQSLFAYTDATEGGGPADTSDSAAYAPLGVVTHESFDWRDDRHPRVAWHDTVIYEVHVKGMTALHPQVPPDERGTYLGLSHPDVIDHLRRLGVTAVELMPVHFHVDEQALVKRGLTNYWGYNTLGFFAPDARFSHSKHPHDVAAEFKTMVRRFHAAGLEVILDVVYNHTAEGNHLGPHLSFRGLDNTTYYRLEPGRPSRYQDFTGTGNTINVQAPQVLQLMMDSLRYWVQDMHVDGFRFDLASALARELHAVDRLGSFFDVIQQDPVISRVKLIAEPWDVGPGGYQVGNFPPGWAEWNGRYRDTVRHFWRGDAGMLPDLATRLAGSSDLYGPSGRQPHASVNFVTAHDGYTLVDLVAYEQKHNDANGEDNQDGDSNNISWNCGVEGPTDDPDIMELRRRQRRNFLATLVLSQGVPMISGGDELGRSQHGNNNAYCHDSGFTWTPWEAGPADEAFHAFAQFLIAIRRDQPVLRRRTFLAGRRAGSTDVLWLKPDGTEFTDADWNDASRSAMGMLLDGRGITETDARGRSIVGDSLFAIFNGGSGAAQFTMPAMPGGGAWTRLADTADPAGPSLTAAGGTTIAAVARSISIWRI
ncbi:MAG TPA: glycogen debranching protein GlgX [Vicinamibacterales bacterium]|nr:glycogen debranching protein GlgX [Vicinamibacterales bacterium]